MAYRLGVDLGTTFTAAAVANAMPPTMLGLGNRALQIPSVLFVSPEGTFLAGEAAERRGLAQPDRVVREFKRRIGDTVPMLLGGVPYSPQALAAKLLRHVVQIAGERMGSPPDQVVLTHPANWGPFKLELLDQVAVLAEAGPVLRCPEPLAAAVQYAARSRVEVGATIAVYDLGGGTFDACVLQKLSTGFALLGRPEGIEHLGGIDFDDALFRHVLGMLGDRLERVGAEDPEAISALTRLRRDCVEAKEALSADTDTPLAVALPGLSTTLRLNRSEFEALIRPALGETVRALDRTLRSANVAPDQLSAIVLIGGSSRIPLVGELLHESFAIPMALDTHPKHDVALGAVRQVDPGGSEGAAIRPPVASYSPPGLRRDVQPQSPGREGTQNARPRLLPIGAAVVVTVGLVTGVALVNWVSNEGRAGGLVTEGTRNPTGANASSGVVGGLPVSAAVRQTQLIVPVLAGDNWDLWLGDITQQAPLLRLTSSSSADTTPALSPDGRTVIYTHDLDTDGKRILLVKGASTPGDGRPLFSTVPNECQGTMFRPAWHPRRDELAVPCVDAKGKYGLYRVTTDGRLIAAVMLPRGAGRVDDPSYSPDGQQLVFWAAPPSTWDGGTLYTVSVTGGAPKVLLKTSTIGEDADPVWAPDGTHIAFRRRVPDGTTGGNFEIFRIAMDGSARLDRLTDNAADDQDPAYSPSGAWIAYKSSAVDPKRPDNVISRIWIMDSDGGNKRLLWVNGKDNSQTAPGWGRR